MISLAAGVYHDGMSRWTRAGRGVALRLWVGLSALLLGPGPWGVHATAGDSAEDLTRRIDSLYHKSPHWQVAFDQKVHYPVFDETEQESGTLCVGPEGRFRLTTNRHVIVSDGDTLWTHNLRANQLVVDLVERSAETVRPADFLFRFKEDYTRALCDDEGPGTCLYLKATDETAFIREMWLWADPKTSHVKRAVYKDINLNQTTFDFKTIDFKFSPPAGLFRYEAPPGVEVVSMPRSE